ncbi:glycoside hydrolase family 3 domain protein [Emticicia oligotrophica DSM 17448]|uniref:beta-N-acetylhexosaminidase n=1 Tax=Emticicia oligotrophica (strain DSM 17448 / CIP 109782 / MTCC 6937 / GPTSA100-15) TaxID=929562 RepID=A0ABM5N0B2_EMTOG|nr:glycoside hydrolase family 3 N-terminal domain-containing protein [Emticicia oligotrophica]AFK02707.1 glycoside hydrolase family 3 domain protein [Emticicia oligotrophica DSM 17448]
MKKIFLSFFLFFSVFGSFAQKDPDFLTNYNKRWVDSVFATLTLEEKIGQLLMPRGNTSGKPHDVEKLKRWVKDSRIGGIVMFAAPPTIQARIVNELQALSKVPLLIGMDLEWGLAMRLDSTVRFPYQMTLGAMKGNEKLLFDMGVEVAKQCRRMGVHINYAPVVDVNINPNNPVINFRSFGENPVDVANKALAYMQGMNSQNLLTSAKHFPGHGDTGVDSHFDLPLIPHDRKRLNEVEFYPYKKLIENGLSGIMTSHLSVPILDTTKNLAATFSKKIVTDVLRKDLNFKGLTFTDAMDMQGAIKYFSKGEANVRAVLAGNDILETFEDAEGAIAAIKTALANKEISMEEIDFRVRKILMAKSWVGLDKYRPTELNNLLLDLNTIQSDLLNRQLAEASITLVKNNDKILPIKDLTQKIATVSIDAIQPTAFQKMTDNYTTIDHFILPPNAADSSINKVLEQVKNYDLILVGLHLNNIRPAAKYGITDGNKKALKALTNTGKAITTIFGNPYTLDKFDDLEKSKAIVMAYQLTNYMEEAAAQAIFGAIPMVGKLPVSVNSTYRIDMGENTQAMGRLAYGIPEMVGLNGIELNSRIDSVINLGLREKAYPGATMEIAKDGRVIYQKAFGYHTYEAAQNSNNVTTTDNKFKADSKNDVMDEAVKKSAIANNAQNATKGTKGAVRLTDLYDLASVTKVSTSALAVMQLMSEGKFDLDKTFKDYYPEFADGNKANLRFRDMLTHKSGLKAWIPFWMDCIDSVKTVKSSVVFKEKYASQYKKKLFMSKKKYNLIIAKAIKENKTLWKDCLSPKTLVWKPNTLSTKQNADYTVQVADSLWLHKDYRKVIFDAIENSPVKPEQGYVYSDLHYYTYPTFIANIVGMPWEDYLKKTYKQMGANSLTYNPLRFYSREQIVPSERDTLFRKTLIHGRVHDEGAGLLDGISGHAGLFGNVNDLTKLMQMYLQKGYYGGKQFIKPEVIAECTKYQFPEIKNRRAIAFDKLDFNPKVGNGPTLASPQSYGHSGFTGTFVWVEPKYNFVYTFLSNRVYPTRDNTKISSLNIRTEVGDQIYKMLQK